MTTLTGLRFSGIDAVTRFAGKKKNSRDSVFPLLLKSLGLYLYDSRNPKKITGTANQLQQLYAQSNERFAGMDLAGSDLEQYFRQELAVPGARVVIEKLIDDIYDPNKSQQFRSGVITCLKNISAQIRTSDYSGLSVTVDNVIALIEKDYQTFK